MNPLDGFNCVFLAKNHLGEELLIGSIAQEFGSRGQINHRYFIMDEEGWNKEPAQDLQYLFRVDSRHEEEVEIPNWGIISFR